MHDARRRPERRPAAALLAPHPARRARHRRPAAPARGARAGDRRRRAGLAGGAVPGHGRRRPHHAGRPRHRRPDQPAAADRAQPVARRPAQGRLGGADASPRSTPRCRCIALQRARRAQRAGRAGRRRRRGGRLQRQLRHPPRGQRACVAHRKPLVSGAAIGFDGQISVYDTRDDARRPATPACSRPRPPSRRCAARPWACSRRWWASSARCRPPRR